MKPFPPIRTAVVALLAGGWSLVATSARAEEPGRLVPMSKTSATANAAGSDTSRHIEKPTYLSYEIDTKQAAAPEVHWEPRTRTLTKYRLETRKRRIVVESRLAETKEVPFTYTETIPHRKTRIEQYFVNKPFTEKVAQQFMVMVPEVRPQTVSYTVPVPVTRPVTQKYTVMVPEKTTRSQQYVEYTPVIRQIPQQYTICVPEQRTRTVHYTVKVPVVRPVQQQYTVMVPEHKIVTVPQTISVPSVRPVQQQYTVMVPQTQYRTQTYCVRIPQVVTDQVPITVMVPQLVERRGERTVCQMIPVLEDRETYIDEGSWKQEPWDPQAMCLPQHASMGGMPMGPCGMLPGGRGCFDFDFCGMGGPSHSAYMGHRPGFIRAGLHGIWDRLSNFGAWLRFNVGISRQGGHGSPHCPDYRQYGYPIAPQHMHGGHGFDVNFGVGPHGAGFEATLGWHEFHLKKFFHRHNLFHEHRHRLDAVDVALDTRIPWDALKGHVANGAWTMPVSFGPAPLAPAAVDQADAADQPADDEPADDEQTAKVKLISAEDADAGDHSKADGPKQCMRWVWVPKWVRKTIQVPVMKRVTKQQPYCYHEVIYKPVTHVKTVQTTLCRYETRVRRIPVCTYRPVTRTRTVFVRHCIPQTVYRQVAVCTARPKVCTRTSSVVCYVPQTRSRQVCYTVPKRICKTRLVTCQTLVPQAKVQQVSCVMYRPEVRSRVMYVKSYVLQHKTTTIYPTVMRAEPRTRLVDRTYYRAVPQERCVAFTEYERITKQGVRTVVTYRTEPQEKVVTETVSVPYEVREEYYEPVVRLKKFDCKVPRLVKKEGFIDSECPPKGQLQVPTEEPELESAPDEAETQTDEGNDAAVPPAVPADDTI